LIQFAPMSDEQPPFGEIIPINVRHPLVKIEEQLLVLSKTHPQWSRDIAHADFVIRKDAANFRSEYLRADGDQTKLPDDRIPDTQLHAGITSSPLINTEDASLVSAFLEGMGVSVLEAKAAVFMLQHKPKPLHPNPRENNVGDITLTAPQVGMGFDVYLRTSGQWDIYARYTQTAYHRMQMLDLPPERIDTSFFVEKEAAALRRIRDDARREHEAREQARQAELAQKPQPKRSRNLFRRLFGLD